MEEQDFIDMQILPYIPGWSNTELVCSDLYKYVGGSTAITAPLIIDRWHTPTNMCPRQMVRTNVCFVSLLKLSYETTNNLSFKIKWKTIHHPLFIIKKNMLTFDVKMCSRENRLRDLLFCQKAWEHREWSHILAETCLRALPDGNTNTRRDPRSCCESSPSLWLL